MIETDKIGNITIAYATEGLIYDKTVNLYARKIVLLPGQSTDNFIEVERRPRPTNREYSTCVEQLIRQRYSVSEELAILRQRDSKPAEFVEYNEYAEHCKQIARIEAEELAELEKGLSEENPQDM